MARDKDRNLIEDGPHGVIPVRVAPEDFDSDDARMPLHDRDPFGGNELSLCVRWIVKNQGNRISRSRHHIKKSMDLVDGRRKPVRQDYLKPGRLPIPSPLDPFERQLRAHVSRSDLEWELQAFALFRQDPVNSVEFHFCLRVEFTRGAVRVYTVDPHGSKMTNFIRKKIVIDRLVSPNGEQKSRPVAANFGGSERFQARGVVVGGFRRGSVSASISVPINLWADQQNTWYIGADRLEPLSDVGISARPAADFDCLKRDFMSD